MHNNYNPLRGLAQNNASLIKQQLHRPALKKNNQLPLRIRSRAGGSLHPRHLYPRPRLAA